jgi:hypothetical protein
VNGWKMLEDELRRWAECGRVATLWWRDDDAEQPTPALDTLLRVAGDAGAPLALAVIPAGATRALAAVIGHPEAAVLQHGYAHRNHAPEGAKKEELGTHRPFPHTLGELATGHEQLATLFGGRALPVLVPPWNRMAPQLVPMLPEIGYRGLSTYGPRGRARPIAGLLQANTHIDVIDWAGGRDFIGAEAALGLATAHLGARRRGDVDADEPTGLLTHHLAQSGESWEFLSAFARAIADNPGARWIAVRVVFGLGPADALAAAS